MAVARGVMCIECLKKGHSCQAQIMLEQEDDSHQPFCLPCADSEPCAYERNPPIKTEEPSDIFSPVIDVTMIRKPVQDAAPITAKVADVTQDPIVPKKRTFFKQAAQHIKTDQHKEWEKAIVEDAGKTSVTGLSIKLGCKPWHVYHYRKLHSIPCSGASAGSRPRNTEIKQQIAADNGKTPTKTLARDLGIDHKYVKREREKMQEQPKPETNLDNMKKSASYQYVIADLEAKRDELNAVIAGLKAMVQMGEMR